MPTVAVNGVDLYYEVQGEGLPVLGIHGTPSSSALWGDAAARLGTHGRCIVYDRRGFGRSGPDEPLWSSDLSDQVEDAIGLLEALDAVPAVVIGRSTGGLIALDLALRRPDVTAAVVLLEPAVFGVDPGAAAWAAGLRSRVMAAEHGKVSAGEVVIRDALGDDVWESLPGELKEIFGSAGPAVLAEMRGRGLDLSPEPQTYRGDELAGATLPALVVSAEDSPVALRRVCEVLAEALPEAEHVRVPGGHLIDPAGPAVLDFVDRAIHRM